MAKPPTRSPKKAAAQKASPAKPAAVEAPPASKASEMFSWSLNPTRTLIIAAVGAVAGLALAGFGLFTAKGTSMRTVPPEAVAMVNSRPVLMADYIAQLEAEEGVQFKDATKAQRDKVLQEMLSEELFVQRGLETDEPSVDPDVRAALVNAVSTQVAVNVTTKVPTEVEMKDYYEKNKANYSSMGLIVVKDLVGAPGADAAKTAAAMQAAVAELRAGQPLDAVAARHGLRDTGRVKDEELYFAAKIHLGSLYDTAEKMKSGEAQGPIQTADGPHLLYVPSNISPQPRDYDRSKVQVMTDYKATLEKKMSANEDKFLRERADILIAKAFQ